MVYFKFIWYKIGDWICGSYKWNWKSIVEVGLEEICCGVFVGLGWWYIFVVY